MRQRSRWSTLAAAVVALCLVLSLGMPALAASNEVWLLPIDGEINAGTTAFVRSRVQQANNEQPLAIVLFLDTPGGAVKAMQDIVGIVLHDTNVPTIAVVQNAFSAGALIAMSAEQLAMLPGASIGAALPILMTPTGIAQVDEKFSSALRGEFRSVAEARGRNADVAAGMVDERIEIPGLSTSSELVTLTARQAVEFGIADTEAATLSAALAAFGYAGASVKRLEPGLAERLAALLSQPLIAALLLVVGIGGLLIEVFTPGFGIPGAIGVVALAVFAAAAYFADPAGIFDVAILVVGIVLIAVEAFVLPGFGVAGVLGLAAITVALVRIFEEGTLPVLGYVVLFGGVLLGVLLWMLPNSRLAAIFRLSTRLTSGADSARASPAPHLIDLVGTLGTSLSDLRPAGVARFGADRVDVMSEGDFIPVQSVVKVLRVEGNRVTVRAVDTEVGAPHSHEPSNTASQDGDEASAATPDQPSSGKNDADGNDEAAANGREEA